MKIFDRAILIFIGLGIWALAMIQVFKPSSAVDVGRSCGTEDNPCIITTPSFGFGHSLPLLVTINNSFMNAVPIRTEPSLFRTNIHASLLRIQDALNTQTKIFVGWDEKKDDK